VVERAGSDKAKNAIELALNVSDIERINKSGKIAASDLEGGYDLHGIKSAAPCKLFCAHAADRHH
jgi:hypothetical protein